MPNRILRDGINSSERIARLQWPEEVLYRRLMSVVDDYGRTDANPQLLRSRCYPLQTDRVRTADISRWLAACQQAGLILHYEVDGKWYLEIRDFGQKQRTDSKFPAPPEGAALLTNASKCPQMLANARLGEGVFGDEGVFGGGGGGGESPGDKPPDAPSLLISAWEAAGLGKVLAQSDGRKKAINARLADAFWRDNYPAALERMAKSRFCRGENDRGWKADLDFFLKPDTLTRVLEGRYDDKPKARRHPSTGQPLKGGTDAQ